MQIRDPSGGREKADVRFNNDKNLSYSVSYVPRLSGDYKIFVTFLGKDIPNSPFRVSVLNQTGDASKVKVSGQGLKLDGNSVGTPTSFDINTSGEFRFKLPWMIRPINSLIAEAGSGSPEVIVLDPSGHKTTVPVSLRQMEPLNWRCEYISHLPGLHSVNVFFAGEPIPNSPFGVKIAPSRTPRRLFREASLIPFLFQHVIQGKFA